MSSSLTCIINMQVYCVNNGAVMNAWGIDQKVEGSIIKFMGDRILPLPEMEPTHPGSHKRRNYRLQ
jgi:hypothetical protein